MAMARQHSAALNFLKAESGRDIGRTTHGAMERQADDRVNRIQDVATAHLLAREQHRERGMHGSVAGIAIYVLHLLLGFAFASSADAAVAAQATTLAHYVVRAEVAPAAKRLSVQTTVMLPPAAASRASLQFRLRTDMGLPQVRLVGPNAVGDLRVRRVSEADDVTEWRVDSATSFPAKKPIALEIANSGGGKTSLLFYVGPEIVFANGGSTPWYPQFFDGRGVGSLSLDLPGAFFAPTSGERMSEQVRAGRRHIEFRITKPSQFSFTAGPYRVQQAKSSAGERPVALYLLRDRDFAAELAETARRSISILEKEFGRFPFEEFSVVEVPSGPAQKSGFIGAGFDGYMLMRADYMDRKRADPFFFGHEIGHQWWGVSVTNGGETGEFMLDEALAQYGGLRVVEGLRGVEEARDFRAGVGEYQGATDAIGLIVAGHDQPLARLPKESQFYDLSDTKGYLVYDLFSRAIGADRLRRFFHEITSTYASSSITWEDFIVRLRSHARAENHWLIDQWLNQKGLPVLALSWTQQSSGVSVVISQLQKSTPVYRLQAPVRLTFADGTAEMRIAEVGSSQTSHSLKVSNTVTAVELDPDRTVPWVSPEEFATAVALRNATEGKWLWDHGQTARAEKVLKAALNARTAPDATPAEFLERFYYGWIIEEAGRTTDALDQYQRALRAPARDETELPQLYLNIARVASKTGDKALARWAATAAIALDERRKRGVRTMKERALKYME